ncbi:MAG: putative zinc-binding protein [Negativicutes bacterium]|nr:putative zinc-binding protein [Negativicutes bacterium]
MGCSSCQSTEKISRVVYGCAGCADVGFVADDVSRKLRRDGYASPKASCLAGIGAGFQPFINAAKAADMVITIDGCEIGCAKKVIENIGLTPQSFILTQMGLKKGETIPSMEISDSLCLEIMNQCEEE